MERRVRLIPASDGVFFPWKTMAEDRWYSVWKENPEATAVLEYGDPPWVVSLLRIFERRLIRDDETLGQVAGIGGVYTPPECRNKGHASVLLRSVLPLIADAGWIGAALHSKSRDLYARAGFVIVPSRTEEPSQPLWLQFFRRRHDGEIQDHKGFFSLSPDRHF